MADLTYVYDFYFFNSQYLTHAHKHITLVMAAVDRCFVLIRTHQHGIRAAA